MKKILGLAALAIILTPALVQANDHEGGKRWKWVPEKLFEKHDTDKNGTVSKTEFMTHHEERFTEMDKNANGEVTMDEAKAHHEAMKEKYKAMKAEKEAAGEEAPAPAPEEESSTDKTQPTESTEPAAAPETETAPAE